MRAVLKEEKVKIGPNDRVEPALGAEVNDGLDVTVFRAFDVIVDFDGTVATDADDPHERPQAPA